MWRRPTPWRLLVVALCLAALASCAKKQAVNDDPSNPAELFYFITKIRHSDSLHALKSAEQAYLNSKSLSSNWRWRFRLLYAELLLDQGPNSKVPALLEFDLPAGSDHAEAIARITSLRGYIAQRDFNWGLAEKLYNDSLSAIADVNDPCWKAELRIHHQAQTLLHLSNYNSASDELSKAENDADACQDKYWKNLLFLVKGNFFLNQHRYEEAVLWFQRCSTFARANNFKVLLLPSEGNVALGYFNLGDLDKALITLNQVNEDYKHLDRRTFIQSRDWGEDKGHRARVYSALGRYPEAIKEYQEAIRIANETGDIDYLTRWYDELTSLYLDTGDFRSADILNRQVLKASDPHRDFAVAASARLNSARLARISGQCTDSYAELQELQKLLLADSNVPDPKLTWQLHIEMAQTLAAMKRDRQARLQYNAALKTAEAARQSINSDDYRLTFSTQLRKLYQAYVDFLIEQKDVTGALQAAESAHARLLAEKLNRPSDQRAPADFTQIARAKNAVILSYWIAPGSSYMWATTGQGSKMFRLPRAAELEKIVKQLNQAIIEERDLLREPERSRLLYDKLIAPASDLIRPGANVIIIPDGPLSDLNFETLIPPSAPPRYWLESVVLQVAPSLTLLRAEQQHAFHPKSLLLTGAAIQADPEMAPLPASEHELRSIQQLFETSAECRLLTGAEATPSNFRQANPTQYSIIHLSAHAVPNQESPLDSAILLSPDKDNYKLYAHDLAGMRLMADLVTLSACQSAGAKNVPGEGLVGLTWAVLGAGAHNVIASLWKVPDNSTYRLMSALYRHIHEGETPADALHSAKLEMAKQPQSVPFDWAAFQLYTR